MKEIDKIEINTEEKLKEENSEFIEILESDIINDDTTNNKDASIMKESLDDMGAEVITDDNCQDEKVEQKQSVLSITNANGFITKTEGFLMFFILIVINILCCFGISKSINIVSKDNADDFGYIKQQIQFLSEDMDVLESEVTALKEVQNDKNKEFDTRPFLGVGFAEEATEGTLGLKIAYVYENSPAAFAKIKIGDIITKVNNAEVKTFEDLTMVLEKMQAKDVVKINLITIVNGEIKEQVVETTLTYRGNFNLD